MSAPVAERYVDRVELGHQMHVSVSTIKRWDKAGRPSETWGMRRRYYLVSACIEWARARGDTLEIDQTSRRAVQRSLGATEGDSFDG